ncbi:hypothetical protein KKC45_01165 [Patescibacteria group bacterium]|nr:hypothetical protein [Patescibacteria group bacterium]
MDIKSIIFNWQTLLGAVIGASAPFLLWWFTEVFIRRRRNKEDLYYLEKVVVDQINLLSDIEMTIERFLTLKVKELINNINDTPPESYSADTAFFPLFSTRPLPYDVVRKSSGSGYLDNKIAKAFSLSEDFPHIIKDLRHQFEDTLNRNEKMAFNKLNSPEVQKEQFKINVQVYEKVVREDMLGKNIPMYFKKLTETLVAIRQKSKMSSIGWKIKFDPRWRWYPYLSKKSYFEARAKVMDKMDIHFKPEVDKILKEIEESQK